MSEIQQPELSVIYIGGTYYGPFGPSMMNDACEVINSFYPDLAKKIVLRSYQDLKDKFADSEIEIP